MIDMIQRINSPTHKPAGVILTDFFSEICVRDGIAEL